MREHKVGTTDEHTLKTFDRGVTWIAGGAAVLFVLAAIVLFSVQRPDDQVGVAARDRADNAMAKGYGGNAWATDFIRVELPQTTDQQGIPVFQFSYVIADPTGDQIRDTVTSPSTSGYIVDGDASTNVKAATFPGCVNALTMANESLHNATCAILSPDSSNGVNDNAPSLNAHILLVQLNGATKILSVTPTFFTSK